MTDRLYALTVVLEQDIRKDDAEPIIDAIRMIRGVGEVTAHISEPATYAAEARAKMELKLKIIEILNT